MSSPQIRPQPRELCDLRDERPGSGRRTSIWQALSGRRASSPQRPRSPAARGREGRGSLTVPGRPAPAAASGPFETFTWEADAEWPADELPTLPQRRVSQLDNIPETSETTGANETNENTETGETTLTTRPAETGAETADGGSGPVSSPPAVNTTGPGDSAVRPDDSAAGAEDAMEQSDRPDSAVRARASSLGTPRRLGFPRLRRRSSQRRQSAEGSGREPSREPRRERSWLRRFSRSRLKADQPPEPPEPEPEQEPVQMPNLAARRWGIVRSNFDLDAPLTDHWGFLESVVNEFEKVDAKTYTEHLHEQSPLSSSTSEEEVPDALEAQLMLKLAQSELIRPRKAPVSRRCVKQERQRRRAERRRSAGEESTGGESDGKGEQETAPSEQWESVELGEPRLEPPGPAVELSGPGERSPAPRASSCPPPRRYSMSPVPSAGHRRRGSLFDRLLPSGRSHPPSLPPPTAAATAASTDAEPAADTLTVHHPTWFQRAAGPEAAAGPALGQHPLSLRRATVAEVSLQEFMGEVREKTEHLREEEFCGTDPYQVLAPEQLAADDDHVVPLLDAPRCVGLMLADAEKRLDFEYSNPPTPARRLSPCPTPTRGKTPDRGGAPQSGQVAGSAKERAGGSPDPKTQDGAGPSRTDKPLVDSADGRPPDGAGGSSKDSHNADTAGCSAEEKRTAEVSQTTDQRRPGQDKTTAHSESQCGAPVVPQSGSVIFSKIPEYLTTIQHEMAAVTESLRTKIQATLSSAHDSEPPPSTHRSKSPKSARRRSRSASSAHPGPSGTKATKSIPSTTRTPRNSLSHPTQQTSTAGPRSAPSTALAGTAACATCPACPPRVPAAGSDYGPAVCGPSGTGSGSGPAAADGSGCTGRRADM